jgi:dipeptidyl aminopeptidase/acylaminoacyl peptidase
MERSKWLSGATAVAMSFAMFFGASGAAADSAQLPTEYFTKHADSGSVKISPDGLSVGMLIGKFGKEALSFVDLATRKVTGGVRAPEGLEILDFEWVSPNRAIYTIAERQLGNARPVATGEIFGVDRDGSKSLMLYGYRFGRRGVDYGSVSRRNSYATPEIISTLRNDPDHILIAEYPWEERGRYWHHNPDAEPRISMLNVYNGRVRVLERAPLANAYVLADRNDKVRFATGRTKDMKQAVLWKPTPEDAWKEFALPGFNRDSVMPWRFTADNNSVLFTATEESASVSALYQIDLATHAVKKLHAFDYVDIENIVVDFTDRELIGVRAVPDKPVTHWIAPDNPAARLIRSLEKAFPGKEVIVTSASDDGRLAIVYTYSDTSPGDYFLFDIEAKKAEFIRSTRSWVDAELMRPMEPIEVKARDGLKLRGYLTKPAGDGPHPLIVMPHGGPHGVRDYWGYDSEVQLFANRGYAVLQINFRGSGGYGDEFETAGYRQWGATMQDDLTDATRWAIDQGVTQADRVCIYGASYGGYAALMGVAREPKLYQCAIGYVGVYDLELMYESGDIPGSKSGIDYLKKAVGEDRADLRARSPVHMADRIEAPVLLLHGKDDGRVDFAHAKRMRAALDKHRKKYEWLTFGNEGHGVYDENARRQAYDKILDFLNRHLPVSKPAT